MSRTRSPICASSLYLSRGIRRPPRVRIYRFSVFAELDVQDGATVLCLGRRWSYRRTHRTHRFADEDELAKLHVDLGRACQENMIAAAAVDDQELAIGTELARIDNPAVAG